MPIGPSIVETTQTVVTTTEIRSTGSPRPRDGRRRWQVSWLTGLSCSSGLPRATAPVAFIENESSPLTVTRIASDLIPVSTGPHRIPSKAQMGTICFHESGTKVRCQILVRKPAMARVRLMMMVRAGRRFRFHGTDFLHRDINGFFAGMLKFKRYGKCLTLYQRFF